MKGWKCTSRELLKAIFCHQKRMNNDRVCMKFSSTPILACINPSIPYFKINTPFFCWFLFFKEISTPRSRSAKWQTRIVLITTLVLQHFSENLFPPLAEGGISAVGSKTLSTLFLGSTSNTFLKLLVNTLKKLLLAPAILSQFGPFTPD